jgi:hypothetical protein
VVPKVFPAPAERNARVFLCLLCLLCFLAPLLPCFFLTHPLTPRYTILMAHSYLIFDFGADEDAAQQARHKLEGWKQGFRLGNKLLLKFEREESPEKAANKDGAEPKSAAPKKKSAAHEKEEKSAATGQVRLLVRLDFSDHEKLSHQRWLDRIPSEEPFKSVDAETVRATDADFTKTAELFESLD